MPIKNLNRSIFRLSGESVVEWLDGIITNSLKSDINFAAILTPQGKIIADFFVTKHEGTLLIDTPTKFATDLHKRLKLYKLRAQIEITDLSETHSVYAIWDEDDFKQGYVDPRHPSLGQRLITTEEHASTGDYNAHRLSLGVVESEWDFESIKVFPADANMDVMNGVDFQKGCFVGQEVVSRMKRMTTVKKRMRGVIFNGAAEVGDRILTGERVIGDILSVHGQIGMALIRLDRLSDAETTPTVNDVNIKIMDSVDGYAQ